MQTAVSDGVGIPRGPIPTGVGIRRPTDRHRHAQLPSYASVLPGTTSGTEG
ncbi:hypothetical protein SsS58_06683 [Streptomyces scabiei]|uniref:Uncharacterized protein n=1 Tax=Streptomyces scabiei TaxID=1930 RepID=A0A100JV51_STRSC|nr:hypothetical protein SsS58_06683 [Streptomyces scabiei]